MSGSVTCTVRVEAMQLFVSLVSFTAFKSSAQARRKYVPNAAVLGTLTVTEPVELPDLARPGTARLPVSRMALTLFCGVVER